MNGILIIANRPLSLEEIGRAMVSCFEYGTSMLVVKVPDNPERTVFLTEQAMLWKRHFDAL